MAKKKAGKNKKSNGGSVAAGARTSAATIPVPAAIGNITRRATPKVTFAANGDCTVSHTEYMFDVDASTGSGFSENVLLNPQSNLVFTWLSALATRFEQYRFSKLKFHFKTSVGTSTSGWVVMGFDFDPYDDDLPTKVEMLAWKYATKGAAWTNCTLDVSQDAKTAIWRYADSTPSLTGTTASVGYEGQRGDLRFDYLGRFIVRAVSTATMSLGEVYVEYTVHFRQPSYKVPPALYASITKNSPAANTSDWFSDSNVYGNMNFAIADTNKLLIKQPGAWLLNVMGQAASGLASGITVTMSTPADSPTSAGNLTTFFTDSNGTSNKSTWLGRVNVDTAPMLLTFSGISGTDFTPWLEFATFAAKNQL